MGNPLASPEVLGVGAGAGAGYAIGLMVLGLVTPVIGVAASIAGAMAVLAFILTVGMRGQLGPERLLFAGIALNALCSSVLTAIIALGNMQSYALLRWLSGSTNDATSIEAWSAMAALVLVATPLLMLSRWMDVLPLGEATARSLGVPVKLARGILVLIAAIATAVAAMFVGPLSFVGLIAPHLARLLGLARPRAQMAGAILLGALLMIVSDWLARMAAFPYQLPVGLFASLLGGPYLIYLLAKGVPRHG
jgi:ferric hydroxamate transport system permease protein